MSGFMKAVLKLSPLFFFIAWSDLIQSIYTVFKNSVIYALSGTVDHTWSLTFFLYGHSASHSIKHVAIIPQKYKMALDWL